MGRDPRKNPVPGLAFVHTDGLNVVITVVKVPGTENRWLTKIMGPGGALRSVTFGEVDTPINICRAPFLNVKE